MIETTQKAPPTNEMILEWKKEHGKIKCLKVSDNEENEETETLYFYFKPVSLEAFKLANKALNQNDKITYSEIILKDCILNNSEYLQNTDVFAVLATATDWLVSSKTVSIQVQRNAEPEPKEITIDKVGHSLNSVSKVLEKPTENAGQTKESEGI